MPRRRLGVVLLVPSPVADEVNGIRRALGDPALDRIAPHITLVPPVNVHDGDLAEALGLLRRAGASCGSPLALDVGPVTAFHPESPVAYLAVDDSAGRLERLRREVFRGPLERSLDHDFVPHVTVADGLNGLRIEAALTALGSYRRSVTFDRVHLLEQHKSDDGQRRWLPLADVVFGRRTMGGSDVMALELTESSTVDPEAWEVWGRPTPDDALVITARRLDEVVGIVVAAEATGEIVDLVIPEHARGQGISRQLRLQLDDVVAGRS